MKDFGAAGSGFFVERGALQLKRLVSTLREAEQAGQPVLLLGTAFVWVRGASRTEEIEEDDLDLTEPAAA